MANPYRENMDRIQALIRKLSMEHLHSTEPDLAALGDSAYAANYVAISGNTFEHDLEEQLEDLMKEVTDYDSTTETM